MQQVFDKIKMPKLSSPISVLLQLMSIVLLINPSQADTFFMFDFGQPQQPLDKSNVTITPIYLNNYYEKKLVGSNQWEFYSMTVGEQVFPAGGCLSVAEDVIIQVIQTSEIFTDANIYINFNDELPTLYNHSMKCSFYGEDICVINGKELFHIPNITIGIHCMRDCQYKLQVEHQQELVYQTGRSYQLYFIPNQQRVVIFQIPDDPEIQSVEIRGINENKFSKFEMLMAQGNDIPSSGNALFLRPAWENGYVGKFTPDCFCFCRGCNYTVLVSSQDEGYITLTASVSTDVVDLTSSNGGYFDSVLFYRTQCYSYHVVNADKDLDIRIQQYAGDPDVFINPFTKPVNLMEYAFNSRDHLQNEEISISPAERAQYNATVGLYYICVFGRYASTYKITVKNENRDVYLKSGLTESGYLDLNETRTFYYRDIVLAEPDTSITFQTHTMVGSVRMKAKLCSIDAADNFQQVQQKCFYTLDELYTKDSTDHPTYHMAYTKLRADNNICGIGSEIGVSKRDYAVSCVFVVGVIGNFQTKSHFSVMAKVEEKLDPVILQQDVPFHNEMFENSPRYHMFSILDESVKKVIIQLTTIHGDPDLFVSRKTKTPSFYDNEQGSIRDGYYPEIIVFNKDLNNQNYASLTGDYYVTVFGYVQSTFSILYTTEAEGQQKSAIRLLTGKKQKGVITNTTDYNLYKFSISSQHIEDIEIRLDSINGVFKFELSTESDFNDTTIQKIGDEDDPIIFRQNSSDQNSIKTYYIKVQVQQANQVLKVEENSQNITFTYTLAFYEQGTQVHIIEGQPQRGKVENDTFDYYYFDLGQNQSTYDITLSPIFGNPDLVISLTPWNKFPDKKLNDYISASFFQTDSITITSDMISKSQKESGYEVKQMFIGVFTQDQISTFSLLVNQIDEFAPIQLVNGLMQSGKLSQGDKKYYYFYTSGSQQLFVSLIPKTGNPDLAVTIIQNLTMPKRNWKQYAEKPQFQSKQAYGSDIIYLDNNTQEFTDNCGQSCALLIEISNQASSGDSHYTITISKDIQELSENQQLQDSIRDRGQYRFYKFNKRCELCDLEINIMPLSVVADLYLLVNLGRTNLLPTLENSPMWMFNVKQLNKYVISSQDPYFFSTKRPSAGTYTFAVVGYSNVTYHISAHTTTSFTTAEIAKQQGTLNLQKLFQGESPVIKFEQGEALYFYFENWNNAPLEFAYQLEGQSTPTLTKFMIDMRVSTMEGKRLPKKESDLPVRNWISNSRSSSQQNYNQFKDRIRIDQTTKDVNYCTHCYFIVRIENLDQSESAKLRIIIIQQEDQSYGFSTELVLGKPYNLRLLKGQQANFKFDVGQMTQQQLFTTVQFFNGNATIKLTQGHTQLINYPSDKDQSKKSSSLDNYILKFNVKVIQPLYLQNCTLSVSAIEDLHASILVYEDNNLRILPDGITNHLEFQEQSVDAQYFIYIPPSEKFYLTVNGLIRSLDFTTTIQIKILSSDVDSKKHTENLYKTLVNDDQFDFVLTSDLTNTKLSVFQMIPIDLKNPDDLLLLRVSGTSKVVKQLPRYLDLTLSGSEVQFILPGQKLRGVVSNKNMAFKVYEIFLNKNNMFKDDGTDLQIEVIPCNGKVAVYVANDFLDLFNNKSEVSYTDVVQFEKFGKLIKKAKNIQDMGHIYVGIESVNEIYQYYFSTEQSEYEISTKFVKSSQLSEIERYTFAQGSKELRIFPDPDNPGTKVRVEWNQIYHRTEDAMKNVQYTPMIDVTYQLYMGKIESTMYQMRASCQLDKADKSMVMPIALSSQQYENGYIVFDKVDLANVKTIGMFAMVTTPEGEPLTLAYEPTTVNKQYLVVQWTSHDIIVMASVLLVSLTALAILVVYLRSKTNLLRRRLEYELNEVQGGQELQTFDRSSFSHAD